MKPKVAIVVLAAGEGKRLKVPTSKALTPLAGKPLVDYSLENSFKFLANQKLSGNIHFVVGFKGEELKTHVQLQYDKLVSQYRDRGLTIDSTLTFSVQNQQLGTGHALKTFFTQNQEKAAVDRLFCLCVDTPLISAEEFEKMWIFYERFHCQALLGSFVTERPHGLGRIIVQEHGDSFHIVEEKDASDLQKAIKEVNSGFYLFKKSFLENRLERIDNKNSAQEFYLTDVFKPQEGIHRICFQSHRAFLGINGLAELEEVEKIIIQEKIHQLRNEGVRFVNTEGLYIESDVKVGRLTKVEANVVLKGTTKIGENCLIEQGVYLVDSMIGNNCEIKAYSYIENSQVGEGGHVGPFARLRPETKLDKNVKVGNFVEIKKSQLAEGVKVSHLSYVGDAIIGENTNVGCGFITCNYDGQKKHQTIIGKNSFVGSDCQTVAPVEIGNDVYIGSGSTINQDVPDGAFAIARARQTTRPGMAKRFKKKSK